VSYFSSLPIARGSGFLLVPQTSHRVYPFYSRLRATTCATVIIRHSWQSLAFALFDSAHHTRKLLNSDSRASAAPCRTFCIQVLHHPSLHIQATYLQFLHPTDHKHNSQKVSDMQFHIFYGSHLSFPPPDSPSYHYILQKYQNCGPSFTPISSEDDQTSPQTPPNATPFQSSPPSSFAFLCVHASLGRIISNAGYIQK
jgi:hypothetical protein